MNRLLIERLAVCQHNLNVLESLQVWDLIEIDRGLYAHWAIYAGNGMVIHFTAIEDQLESGPRHSMTISGVFFDKTAVKKERFFYVVGNSMAYKKNSKDTRYPPSPAAVISRRAERMLHIERVPYNILFFNCEHFASFCRCGVPISDQADKILAFVPNPLIRSLPFARHIVWTYMNVMDPADASYVFLNPHDIPYNLQPVHRNLANVSFGSILRSVPIGMVMLIQALLERLDLS